MSRIRRIAPNLGRGGLIGNTEGPEAYLRELDTLPSQFCRATGGTETVISQGGKFYRVHTFTDTDPTSLLLNFDGSNGSTTFTDDSGWGHAVAANGNAQISTTQSKFGGSSAYFDGTGDYISTPYNTALYDWWTEDFTLEFWCYPVSLASWQYQETAFSPIVPAAIGNAAHNNSGNYWSFGPISTGAVRLYYFNGSAIEGPASTETVTQGAWNHVALTKTSSGYYYYINGVQSGPHSISGTPQSSAALNLVIGQINNASVNGYIDSLRITKGQALYTAAFTPPTTALSRVGSGSLTVTRGGAVEYLVVGGGGGGGSTDTSNANRAGGGAGGLLQGDLVVASKAMQVSVGGGGAGGASDTADGANGGDSTFASLTAFGGGGSDGSAFEAGKNGGSGGGASASSGAPPPPVSGGTGVSGQGNNGGTTSSNASASGGGGAGEAGGNASTNNIGGSGGDGVSSSISGTLTYYAGGGGGGGSTTSGSGGLGGGGDAVTGGNGQDGTANTGGGGGGIGGVSGLTFGGSGGSGIVIARYRITQAEYEAEAA